MKTYYGKEKESFTEKEQTLFNLDLALFAMVKVAGIISENPIESLMFQISGGIKKIEQNLIRRTIFVGTEILGMKDPDTQEEYDVLETAVEESVYKFDTQMEAHDADFEEFSKTPEAKEGGEGVKAFVNTLRPEKEPAEQPATEEPTAQPKE